MKKNNFPAIGIMVCSILGCANNTSTKTDTAQNKNYLVSMAGIDSLQLDMSKAELEKLLQSTISLPHVSQDKGADTIQVSYKGMPMTIYFDGSSNETATIRGIQTRHTACKTANGIGIGTEKSTVIDAYPGNTKYIAPEYEEYPVRSATKSAVAVVDTMTTHALVFHIIDKKVHSVEVCAYYEFY